VHHSLQDAKTQRGETHPAPDHSEPIRFDRAAVPGRDTSEGEHHHASAPSRNQAPRTNDACDICANIKAHVVNSLGANRVRRYLNERTRMSIGDNQAIEIAAGDTFTLDMIERRLGEHIRIAAQFALGTTEPVVWFRIDETLQPAQPDSIRETQPKQSHSSIAQRVEYAPSKAPRKPAERCPRLEDFIVGASNRLAFESVRQCVESTSSGVPVFVHGMCGVGKTHLLRGATMLARRLYPGCRVRYTTGEAFTNEFVKAIRTRTVDAFQKKYRGLDLLCIDDIHLMAGKQATQHELLNIFNMLTLGGARIILASDAHPRSIARFDQALASRFSSGLVVRVDEPDEELARRLVHQVAHKRGMNVDDACARVICDRIGIGRGASVRDIEGALVQIQAVARLLDRDNANTSSMISPTAGHIRKALALRCGEDTTSSVPLSIDSIICSVCDELSVSISDLKGKGRRKKVVLARELIVHLARQLTSKSFPEIAYALGRSNHSTVITAAKRFKDRLSQSLPVDADCAFDGLPLSELTQRMTRTIHSA
jgi:chromosomal replication initiator protein